MSAGSRERLAALALAFRKRLETDAGRLRALAAQLETAKSDERAPCLEEIRVIAHKLHGTAPAFDAEDVGIAAGELEEAVMAAANRIEDHAALLRKRLGGMLHLLDEICGARGATRTFTPRM